MNSSSARDRGPAAAAAVIAAVAAGCGFGSGGSSGGAAALTVTRDHGHQRLLEATVEDPPESETVIRFLDREAEIETRYGGGFVQSIDGVSGGAEEGRSLDWFFYVNGIESPVGAAEVRVRPGDRIWWDHRDWTDVMRVPAVVGSWPEPFVNGTEGESVAVACRGEPASCDEVEERLEDAGVDVGAGDGPSVLVGRWRRLRDETVAEQLEDGPEASGVFATFEQAGDLAYSSGTSGRNPPSAAGYALIALDDHAGAVATLGAGTGLVAAVRDGDDPPTWLVTGVDDAGVERAAGALGEAFLRDRYAIAIQADGTSVPLPTRGDRH